MANKSFIVQYIIKAREKYVEVANKVSRATTTMRDRIKQANQSFHELSAKTRKAGAVLTATVTTPILLMATSLKNAARDAVETRSKFNTVFRDVAKESQAAADQLAKDFGLSGTKARQLLGDTGDLLSGFGFTGKAALDMSKKVNELAVDLASFTNFSGGAEGASAALTKALLGERESLKSLGIAISEQNVKDRALKLAKEGQRFESVRQAKAIATLSLAMEQSKNAIGDFARTKQDLANQERILGSRLQDTRESLGKLLLPLYLKITKIIRQVVEAFNGLNDTTKKNIIIIAGVIAAIGPLAILFGSIALILPTITTASIALAAAAVAIMVGWEPVSEFFKGFMTGVIDKLGPTLGNLIDKFKESARIIAELFGADSEATKSMTDFANIGNLIGDILGGALRTIINSIGAAGEALGQLMGAVTTLDFSAFDIDRIKAQFFGPEENTTTAINRSQVGVDVNVGLDQGLKQLTPATVSANGNTRRDDVGFFSGLFQ